MDQIAPGLWQFTARHPEWTAQEDWEPDVAWWAHATPDGLVLIDPLVEDWVELDELAAEHGGCAAVIRTCHWHQRSIPRARARFDAPVAAARSTNGERLEPCDRELTDGDELPGGIVARLVKRADELALWLPGAGALVFGDAMVRDGEGALRVCPPSWTQPPGGRAALLDDLRALADLEPRHVLVSHGPLLAGDGASAIRAALAEAEAEAGA